MADVPFSQYRLGNPFATAIYAGATPMQIDPALHSTADNYKVLTNLVVPRPIAWITSQNRSGVVNLAPFRQEGNQNRLSEGSNDGYGETAPMSGWPNAPFDQRQLQGSQPHCWLIDPSQSLTSDLEQSNIKVVQRHSEAPLTPSTQSAAATLARLLSARVSWLSRPRCSGHASRHSGCPLAGRWIDRRASCIASCL